MSPSAPPMILETAPLALDDLDGIARIYPHNPDHFNIVRPQIEQRASLIKTWGIKPGERVLEIGCGQGDCTLVLAAAVGDEGSVTALDLASLDYAQAYLKASALGARMTFVQSDPIAFLTRTTQRYTTAVLALLLVLRLAAGVVRHPCRAPGARRPRVRLRVLAVRTTAHVLATFAQAAFEVHKDGEASASNVRTVFSPARLRSVAVAAGLRVESETLVRPPEGMLDGRWEVAWVLSAGFAKEVDEHVKNEREKAVVIAARDSVQAAVELLKAKDEKVSTMDIWVATFVKGT